MGHLRRLMITVFTSLLFSRRYAPTNGALLGSRYTDDSEFIVYKVSVIAKFVTCLFRRALLNSRRNLNIFL